MTKTVRNLLIGICIGILICLALFMWIDWDTKKYAAAHIDPRQSFNDVPPDHWAYEEIEFIFSRGITVGCSLGPLYCPDRPMTRAEVAVFAARILEIIEQSP